MNESEEPRMGALILARVTGRMELLTLGWGKLQYVRLRESGQDGLPLEHV